MQTTHKFNDDDGLALLDLRRALEDEIWFFAVKEDFEKGRLIGGSREYFLDRCYAEYPDLKKYVENHVERKTCLFGIRELRRRREHLREAADEWRSALPPRPPKNPEMAWLHQFSAEPLKIEPLRGRPLPPPLWGIPSAKLDRAIEELPDEIAGEAAPASEPPPYKTGLPGRPTSWHLVEAEVRRRFTPSQPPKTTAEWAREMREWLQLMHPNAPLPKEKALTNRLAGLLRRLVANNAR
jgi:hypothetical protein